MVSKIFLKHCYKFSFSKHYLQIDLRRITEVCTQYTFSQLLIDGQATYSVHYLYMCDGDFVSNKLLLIDISNAL